MIKHQLSVTDDVTMERAGSSQHKDLQDNGANLCLLLKIISHGASSDPKTLPVCWEPGVSRPTES